MRIKTELIVQHIVADCVLAKVLPSMRKPRSGQFNPLDMQRRVACQALVEIMFGVSESSNVYIFIWQDRENRSLFYGFNGLNGYTFLYGKKQIRKNLVVL